ncbi:MAG TPA: hypothetical protein VIS99_05520 [Terrimicrobiaceae bacterium]
MSFRSIGLVAMVALMILSCATREATPDTPQQRAEKERLQEHVRSTMGRM